MIEDVAIEAAFDPEMAEYQELRDRGNSHDEATIILALQGCQNLEEARELVIQIARLVARRKATMSPLRAAVLTLELWESKERTG